MSIYVVWVDREHAKLFQFSRDKMERKSFESKGIEHHTHAPDGIDQKTRERKFFGELISHFQEPSKLLILGPGVAKHHFQNYLTEHHPALAKIIAGCETVDHPTDGQIAASAKKFFGSDF